MAGNGGVIIRSTLKSALSEPLIHGQLKKPMQDALAIIFAKDEGYWNAADDHYVSHCIGWVLHNCK